MGNRYGTPESAPEYPPRSERAIGDRGSAQEKLDAFGYGKPPRRESVRRAVERIDFEIDDPTVRQANWDRMVGAYARSTRDAEVAEETIDTIAKVIPVESLDQFDSQAQKPTAMVLPDEETEVDGTVLALSNKIDPELGSGLTTSTIEHELAHLTVEAHGYSIGRAARRRVYREYDPETDPFLRVDLDDQRYSYELTGSFGTDAPEGVDRLVEAVNGTWRTLQSVGQTDVDRMREYVPDPQGLIPNYPAVHAHETLAGYHERFRTDDLSGLDGLGNWFENGHEITRAWCGVFEPSDRMKSVMNYLHSAHPDRSPFDDAPFEDHEIERAAARAWAAATEAGGNPHALETDVDAVLGPESG
ncbi:hypothetical protein BRD17_05805 [Halobacteriales archaeon SW_7_68_16]|nr:MAG: hypothetical protein BRD17_05805 [Halobacteriales archaeon SW_7_68_16]